MVYVFKTSVKSDAEINQISPEFQKICGITQWNFDLEDCDHILRVVSEVDIQNEIIEILKKSDFVCEELPD